MPIAKVQLPDGRIGRFEVPEGTTPEQVMEFASSQKFDAPAKPKGNAIAGLYEQMNPLALAGAADEAGALFDAGTKYVGQRGAKALGYDVPQESFGQRYGQALQGRREDIAAARERLPVQSIAANITGALTTGGLGAGTGASTAIANSLRTGNLAARTGKAALSGATSGSLYGFGEGEGDASSRLGTATSNALTGAAVGGALPLAGAAAGSGLKKIQDYALKNNAIKAGQILPEKLPKELQKVYARLRADFPDDAEFRRVLNSYGSTSDKALVQAGGARTVNLAEGAAQYPSGGARATEFFNEAVGAAPEKLKTVASKTISPSANYYDDLDAMVKAGREKAAPLYNQAFKGNQSVDSTRINRILQTPEGKSALSEAAKNMQNEMSLLARPDPEMTAIAKELESLGMMDSTQGGVAGGLKLKTLDYVKKSMDDTINKAYRAGDEAEARRIIGLKKGLVEELDAADKTGLYKKARQASGDYLSNKEAMDAGLSFLNDDSELVARAYKGMGYAERKAYKVGAVKAVRKQIESTQDGANVARIFNKAANRKKLQSILPEAEYKKLLGEAKATDDLYKLRNQITGNSRTAARQIAAEEFDSQGAQLVDDLARKGAIRTAIDRSVGWIARRFDGLSDKTAKQVADVLYETNPKKKYEIVKFLTNQANAEGSSLRKLQAQRQLEAIYGIEDKVNRLKQTEGMNAQQIQELLNTTTK